MVRKTPCQRGARSTKVERRQGKYGRQPALSHRRLRFFRWIGILAGPVLLLCLLEVSLRVAGYGYPSDATVGCAVDGVAHRGDNVKFGWRFFPRLVAREFEPFVFPARKPEGTYRIFVLGESAAQGVPNPCKFF